MKNSRLEINIPLEQKQTIKRRAEKKNMTVTAYILYATMLESVIHGDNKAIKTLGEKITHNVAEDVKGIVGSFPSIGEPLKE